MLLTSYFVALGAYCLFLKISSNSAFPPPLPKEVEREYFILAKRENGKWFGFGVKDNEGMLSVYERLKQSE